MALLVVALQDRGADVLSYKATPFGRHLPAVASGRLNPEILVRYGGASDSILSAVSSLVREEQEKIIGENPKVEILVPNATRTEYEARPIRTYDLTSIQARLVFGGGKIRTIEEQRPLLPALAPPKPAVPAAPEVQPDQRAAMVSLTPPVTPPITPMPDTAMGYAIVLAELKKRAREAWDKFSRDSADGARRNYVEDALRGSLAYALWREFTPPSVFSDAIGKLLREAAPTSKSKAGSIPPMRPNVEQRNHAHA